MMHRLSATGAASARLYRESFRTVEQGGHLAAFEQPDLSVSEVQTFFRMLR